MLCSNYLSAMGFCQIAHDSTEKDACEMRVKCPLLMRTEQLGPGLVLGESVRLVTRSLRRACECTDREGSI